MSAVERERMEVHLREGMMDGTLSLRKGQQTGPRTQMEISLEVSQGRRPATGTGQDNHSPVFLSSLCEPAEKRSQRPTKLTRWAKRAWFTGGARAFPLPPPSAPPHTPLTPALKVAW